LDEINARKVYRTPEKIIEAAQAAFEAAVQNNPPEYNLRDFNCEHFALKLRYGVDMPSWQVVGDFSYRSYAPKELL